MDIQQNKTTPGAKEWLKGIPMFSDGIEINNVESKYLYI
jgi:hypothetical protein